MPRSDQSIFPDVTQAEVDRWDREWMHYFATEDRYPHLAEHSELELSGSLRGKPPAAIFETSLTHYRDGRALTPLRVWIAGDALEGRKVVEIGCGCGWLGKQVGLIAESYLGIDYSELALAVARGASPPNCKYIHVSRRDRLSELGGRYDTMVGREFFIHQNFENAAWVLGMGAFLLKPGGIISADFYEPDPAIEQGVVHPARSPLDPVHASCAFRYTRAEIAELAERCGLAVQDLTDYRPHQRRFVTFVKQ